MARPLALASGRSAGEAGFTLIEVMVALAVFGLAVLALLNLSGENVRTASSAQTRILAAVVADNQAIEALTNPVPPAIGEARGEEAAGGRTWSWRREVSRMDDPAVLRISVRVAEPLGRGTVAETVVFRGGAT
jgi:general secretion pathway protein I